MKLSLKWFCLGALLTGWLAVPAAAQNRGTAEAAISGKKVSIDYGRPALKGRKDPYKLISVGSTWRLGMDQATGLVTEADLTFGEVKIPKGSYTLFARKTGQGEWALVVNKQTGQWGTSYDRSQDVAEIPLKSEKGGESVEQFTIDLASEGNKGTLKLSWDTTTLWTNFSAN